jgi:hypothetical protein
MSDLDCPTTDPAQFAKCKCGHTAKGTKYCDIEGGDDEWVEAYTLVTYSLASNFPYSSRNILSAAMIVTHRRVSENAMTICIIEIGSVQRRKQSSL